MSSLARDVAYPTITYADPAWNCSTAVLDWQPHWPSDTMDFPEEDATLHAMLPMMRDAITTNNWYGWWDWGGYHQFLRVGLRVPRSGTWADDAGEDIWHRAWLKSHYHWGCYPWVQFMRSGKREWLLSAQTFTLYSADRAHAHYTGNGRDNGAEYHYDNSVVPWMGGYRFSPEGDQIASNLQAKDDYVYAYWLTGSRRALDVLKANGELLIDNHAKGGSWSDYTLMCVTPKALYRQPPFPEMQPEARVLQCDLPMVVGSIDLQQMNLITGRSLHVQVDPQTEQASVFLGPLDPNRSAGLIDSADGWSISTAFTEEGLLYRSKRGQAPSWSVPTR